jgi:hypothetical protein
MSRILSSRYDAKTGDWTQFTSIRQNVILKIAEIVEASGTQFAAPTQLAYVSRDKGVDAQRASDIERPVTDARGGDVVRFPGEARTGRGIIADRDIFEASSESSPEFSGQSHQVFPSRTPPSEPGKRNR